MVSKLFFFFEIEIVALKGIPSNPVSSNSLNYVVDYENNDPVIFKDKFPRFSYRYKYEDGEYSTFAPWSNVAFLPTSFNYEPKTGFNKGMLNNIKYLKVKGFQPSIGYSSTTGLDVVEVDKDVLDFGKLNMSENPSKEVVIKNTGNIDLRILEVTHSPEVSTTFTKKIIKPGKDCMLTVTFNPLQVGQFSTFLRVRTNAFKSPLLIIRLKTDIKEGEEEKEE